MDDNSEKPVDLQGNSTPLMEATPVDEASEPVVEEVAPEVDNPEAVEAPVDVPTDTPPVYQENKGQYMYFILGGAAVFIIFLIIIIRALFGGGGAKKEITLSYWGLWEDETLVKPLIDLYKQKNPNITVKYTKMTPENYREKLIARSKANQGPDIFRYHNTWLPEIKEIVTPLPSSIMPAADFEKTFYPVAQKDLKVGDYYYGIPLMVDGLVLVYNNNMFKKAGIVSAPSTWDDITEIVPKLTVKDQSGNLITSGIAIGTSSNVDHFSDIFGLLLLQNGGKLGAVDSAEGTGALEIYRKFAESPQGYWNDNMPSSTTAFIQEKVAMIIAPSWELLTIKAANPDIDLKVVPVPSVPGASLVSVSSYWVEGVSRYSANQIEAWKFLRFLSEKENMTKLYELQSRVRPFGEPYSRVDLAPLLSQNEYIGAVIKQAPNFTSIPLVSRTYDNGLNDDIIKYIENAINSTTQGVSYAEALKTAKAGITQIFTKYGITN